MLDLFNDVSGLVTALGFVVVIGQLLWDHKRNREAFEDAFVREYRELMRDLPLSAMSGGEPAVMPSNADLTAFFRYFDLCNQQAFMYRKGRVGDEAWQEWLEGIRDNLQLPAFKDAWSRLEASRKDTFTELRKLIEAGFKPRPRKWTRRWWLRLVGVGG